MKLSEIRKTVEKLREQPISLPDKNMALYHVPTVMYLAQHAIDLAAENEQLKDERKRLIENNTILSDALDRANDKLGEIRDMCLLASGKGESYETSWFSGYSACADVIVEIIDKDGDET